MESDLRTSDPVTFSDLVRATLTLGDEKQNLPFFCLPILPRNPLNVLGHIIRRWKDNFKENTTPLESWETVDN